MQDAERGKPPFAHRDDRPAAWHVLALHDFRLLWLGQSIALLGNECYQLVLPWVTLQLSGSGMTLGTVLAVAGIPRAVFVVLGGAFADRVAPRSLMLVSNALRTLPTLALTLLVGFDALQLRHLLVIAFAHGLLDAFFQPASMAIVPRLVPRERLSAANALLQGAAQLSGFAGPALAGFLIATMGLAVASGFHTATLLVATLTLTFMRGSGGPSRSMDGEPPLVQPQRPGTLAAAIGTMFQSVWHDPRLRGVLIIVTVINFLVPGPLSIGLPALAHARFAEGVAALGTMFAAFGGGMLLGTAGAGALKDLRGRGWLLLAIVGVMGLELALLGMVGSVVLATIVLALLGLTNGFGYVVLITWIQKRTDGAMLGRVMSLVLLASAVLAPPSNLVAGAVADLNVSLLFAGAGILLMLTALIGATNPGLRTLD